MISTDSTNRRGDKGPPSNPSGVSKHFRYPPIDFKKAFDSLEWDFMLLTLKRFGFNDSLVNWVKT
jgi:hypothetical protein